MLKSEISATKKVKTIPPVTSLSVANKMKLSPLQSKVSPSAHGNLVFMQHVSLFVSYSSFLLLSWYSCQNKSHCSCPLFIWDSTGIIYGITHKILNLYCIHWDIKEPNQIWLKTLGGRIWCLKKKHSWRDGGNSRGHISKPPGMIAASPLKSKHHLSGTHLAMWSSLIGLRKQHMMPQTKQNNISLKRVAKPFLWLCPARQYTMVRAIIYKESSQKNLEEQLKNCRFHLPQLRFMFRSPQ